ncbi:MAG: flagellar biogenesis protein FliO [Phycisphaerales bacterium]|jgi:flagellar biogenesis protein FliO
MTAQAGWNIATALIATLAVSTGSLAQSSERVFGQLEPGQSVVEIDQTDSVLDSGWTPVARAVPQTLYPDPEDRDFAVDGPEYVPPMGGLNILEELAQRQAEADAASAATAARLALQREQADSARASSETGPTPGPSGLVMTDLPPQENRSIGGGGATRPTTTEATETAAADVEPTNLARDWFRGQGAVVQTLLALGMVILLIYGLSWTYRKMSANQGGVAGINSGKAPSGLLEVLGRYPLGNKQSLVLLKFDRRVLLLAQGPSGKGGIEMKTLCELDEPEDVASVLMKVRDSDGDSLNKAFRSAMSKAEIGASASERMIEPKAAPAPRPARPPRHTQVQPKADVLPGHRDPFNGFGGDLVRPTRTVSSNPEGDRSELWGTPPAAPAANGGHDPVASLKQRLEAMRRGDRVN